MKYTKDDLAKMSDAEINQNLTAIYMGEPWSTYGEIVHGGSAFHLTDPLGNPFYLNVSSYCSDWAAIMPLAVEHDIIHDFMCTEDGGKLFSAYPATDDENITIDFWCDTLQRAIACRLILVLQEREL